MNRKKYMPQNTRTTLTLLLFSAVTFFACADDLRADIETDAGAAVDADPSAPDANTMISGNFEHTDNGDGTTTTIVNSSSYEDWIYLDLSTKEEKTPNNPMASQGWDLAFQRFDITLNGGVSGSGGVEVLAIQGADFDALTVAPATGYASDLADGTDEGNDPDLFFQSQSGNWYDYNSETHVLTPKDKTYVVHSVEGDYYKFRILGYYDMAGTSGHLSFQWGLLDAPAETQQIVVDASAHEEWVYLDIAAGQQVTVSQPLTDANWDLAFRRTNIRTNSGTSGTGSGGAIEIGDDLDTISLAPTTGYSVDSLLPLPGPPGSGTESANESLSTWYDYNPVTHAISPKAKSYVVRHSDGDFSKIQITSYSDGVFGIDWQYAGPNGSLEF